MLLIFVGLQLGMILSTLDGTIVATALPTIGRDLGSRTEPAWVLTGYFLAQVATVPLYGKLGDLYGRKRVYLTALTLFTAGSVLCGAAGSVEQLVAFRLLQGIGSGGLGPLAMAVLADVVPARRLGRWLGYQGALFAVASLVGPLVGGVFVDRLSWRWAFYVNLPLAVISAAIVVLALPIPYRRIPHAIDYAGAALLTTAIASAVLVATIGGREVSWGSPLVVGLVLLTGVCLVLFVQRERRAREPVLPLGMLASRVVRCSAGLNLTSGALFAAGIYFIPVFLQQVRDVSPTESGFLLVPFMFTTAFGTLVAGRRVEATGTYRAWPIAGSVCSLAGIGLLATIGADTGAATVALFGAVLGTGIGFIMQTSLLALQNGVGSRDLGVATSTALLSRMLGVTLGTAAGAAVLQSGLGGARSPGAALYAGALPDVYLAMIPVAIATLALAVRLPEHPLREDARVETGTTGGPG